jgi:hypothetical protein
MERGMENLMERILHIYVSWLWARRAYDSRLSWNWATQHMSGTVGLGCCPRDGVGSKHLEQSFILRTRGISRVVHRKPFRNWALAQYISVVSSQQMSLSFLQTRLFIIRDLLKTMPSSASCAQRVPLPLISSSIQRPWLCLPAKRSEIIHPQIATAWDGWHPRVFYTKSLLRNVWFVQISSSSELIRNQYSMFIHAGISISYNCIVLSTACALQTPRGQLSSPL